MVGCAGQPPQPTHYLLRSDAELPAPAADGATVTGIGAVTVAVYIDRHGLVLETAEGQVRAARHHLWAEPLRASLRTYLAREVAAATGQEVHAHGGETGGWKRRIDVHVDQLHGTADGDALLVASWAVVDPGARAVLADGRFSEREALAEDGYGALVAAEERLLRRLAAAIGRTL